jgi:hypothetical protein
MKAPCAILVSLLWLVPTIPLFGQVSGNCFLEDFYPKYARTPLHRDVAKTTAAPTVTVTINAVDTLGKVSMYLYGNNANTYMGQMVTEPKLIQYISLLSPNVIRFPGGNLSSIYFWDAPNNKPPTDAPDTLIDGTTGKKYKVGYWYGRNTDSWTISVDNYYSMLQMTNSTGIITINYGYARYGTGPDPVATAAHYAADWVRYDDGRTKFWEIGNESGGAWQAGYQIDTSKNQDHQPAIISGALYGKHFLVFADSMRKAAKEVDAPVYIGAQLIHSVVSPPDVAWNAGFFSQARDSADFFIVHNYFGPYNSNSNETVILNSATPECQSVMEYIKQTVNQNHAMLKPVALTEWNINAVGSKQACSFINGVHSALVLGELAKNGYSMSSRWDLANGYDNGNDNGMFNNGDEPGVPTWNPRPAFFYMYYFQRFFGDHIVSSSVAGSTDVVAYASRFRSGHMGVIVVNKGRAEETIKLDPKDYAFGERYCIYSLTGGDDNGQFSQKVYVNGVAPANATGGPIDSLEEISAWACPAGEEIKFTSPARSVQYILIEPGVVSVPDDDRTGFPHRFFLCQNYPNPFNPQTTISYSLPRESIVTLRVYDLIGREVATLLHNDREPAGNHEVSFGGATLPSGAYFYRLSAEGCIETKRMVLIK